MRKIAWLIWLCWAGVVSAQPAVKPPMGWNSYNCFGSAVHEDEVKANADYMAQRLAQYGWQYIVVDFLWSFDNLPGSRVGNPYQSRLADGSFVPWLAMDQWGRLVPHVHKFPSAAGDQGFKPLADYVHGLGLKFGIHIMRGIPRQAVWARSPVLGTNGGVSVTADAIADTSSTCPWLNHMYGLKMEAPGAQEYLNSLLALYASWGVDLIKVDDITRPYHPAEVEGYRKAIAACGRPIVLSLSPGEMPLADSTHCRTFGNMWRMADDFWDSWPQMKKMFNYAAKWQGIGGPGHWPDCDMLQIGKVSKRGPVGPERYSRFTDDELFTHMSFWCLYRSPLMIGGNLPENRAVEERLFSNPEVLAVDQDGSNPRQVLRNRRNMVWISDAGNGALYVGLFNLRKRTRRVAVKLSQLGLARDVAVRDLWQQRDLGVCSTTIERVLPAHGCVLLKIIPEHFPIFTTYFRGARVCGLR